MAEMTKAEFDETVKNTAREEAVDAVTYLIDPEEDEASEAIKSEAKGLPGELQGRIEDAVERALKDKQNAEKGGAEQFKLSVLTDLGEDPANKSVDQPVAKGLEGHWLFDDSTKRHKIGSGKIAADMVTMCMRSIDQFGGLKWNFIEEEADRLGCKQVHEIVEKNQQASDFSQGGALIPPEFSADVIGFLHGSTAVRSIDHVSMELSNALKQGRFSSTATAHYRGESDSVDSSKTVLRALKIDTDADGNLSTLSMMAREDEMMGVPVETTNQIPTDLSGTTDETEVYYVEGSQYVIADATDIEVREYDQATITDASGSSRNLADRGEMAVEMVLSHDANLRHDVGAAVAEQVDWHSEAF